MDPTDGSRAGPHDDAWGFASIAPACATSRPAQADDKLRMSLPLSLLEQSLSGFYLEITPSSKGKIALDLKEQADPQRCQTQVTEITGEPATRFCPR